MVFAAPLGLLHHYLCCIVPLLHHWLWLLIYHWVCYMLCFELVSISATTLSKRSDFSCKHVMDYSLTFHKGQLVYVRSNTVTCRGLGLPGANSLFWMPPYLFLNTIFIGSPPPIYICPVYSRCRSPIATFPRDWYYNFISLLHWNIPREFGCL